MPNNRLSPTANRLIEKQHELEALVQLNQLSHGMAVQLEGLSHQFANGADGALITESVVQRWQNVFRAAHLAIATRANAIKNSTEAPIDMLVRIPIGSTQEEEQSSPSSSSSTP
ncbi:hypothetical protein KEM48_003224 [Puccinia striiformis f. sp. tritici PST-130]|uniref:DASH complex subunit DAD2 n=3 Tax=Puccinia striiformis TaxID=27350 RepID=A0A0L0UW29_9BASI|nr:hypothetical protein Pst134EB_012400 [Puccinia striiformis f. sp. tritici]KAI9605014.1 hypothetical protein H4Q26_002985 [Puccinia striiformis f. sp. tritici PST-130]KAI9608293.1 hypothetical protein KEM48_003224 [Puccinia striiformis f. sp. tritici PST-130]KNE91253.1 hypothetical protein PSTG_15319 [Puccinia striiformis f. sp. tritici PST-78]POV99308.1 hypothetical protein PSTT_13842 [Puccinia striiformis]